MPDRLRMSLTFPPAQKAEPEPVTITALRPESAVASAQKSLISWTYSGREIALRSSGRLSVTIATGPSRSMIRNLSMSAFRSGGGRRCDDRVPQAAWAFAAEAAADILPPESLRAKLAAPRPQPAGGEMERMLIGEADRAEHGM